MLRGRSKEPAIAVVGHLVKDEIISADGRMQVSLGGIAYCLAAFSAILEKGKIAPVCAIGRDIEPMARDVFGRNHAFDLSGVTITDRPNVVNRLVYNPDGSREEWNSRIAPPLRLDRIDRRVDAILLNFISGHDVRLPELKSFRAKYRGIIYCDYHSLALGHDKDLRRYYRLNPWWREYVGMADFLQMNLAELASIYHRPLIDKTAVARACCGLHEAGAGVVIITDGPNGVMLSQSISGRKGEPSMRRFYHLPAVRLRRVIDPTGCGDTLGAAFLCHYLRTRDLIKSLETANHYAAAKATFSGLDGFNKLDNIAKRLGPPPRAIALKATAL